MFKSLFTLRGELEGNQRLILGAIGILLLLAIWTGLAHWKSELKPIVDIETDISSLIPANATESQRDSILKDLQEREDAAYENATEFERTYPILPLPHHVFQTYPGMVKDDQLVINTFKSVWLNLKGYFIAILLAIPIGFVIGLFPLFNGLFSKPVDAIRYLPLTALTGVFMSWFGISDAMKIAFLAFGILVYLLPVVVQRINDVKAVYLKTVFTIGATNWQTIKSVYIPSVLSKVSDDIRVLTAISWTYIIVAELVNSSEGGVGALIYLKARQAQLAKVFAILLIIVLIGFLQDKYFKYLDRKLFPFKYQSEDHSEVSFIQSIINFVLTIVGVIFVLLFLLPSGKAFLETYIGDGVYVIFTIVIIQFLIAGKNYWKSYQLKKAV